VPHIDEGGDLAQILGVPTPPPANDLAAPPRLGGAPTVSSNPNPGQGVALTAAGVLPPSAAATGLRMLTADPSSPLTGEFWYRVDLDKFSIKTATGVKRTAAFT
jgi:hypothetical protein